MPATLTKKVQFQSQGANLTLIRVPHEEILTRGGGMRAIPGSATIYAFKPNDVGGGILEIDPEQDSLPTAPDGSEETAAEWLRRHPQKGERFWEIEAVAPDPIATLSEIAALAAARDEEELARILDEELSGWNREAIVSAAQGALAAIEAVEPEAGKSESPPE